jgi:hypothetical protein
MLLTAVVKAVAGKVDATKSAAKEFRCIAAEVDVPEHTTDESRSIALAMALKEARTLRIALAEAVTVGQVLEDPRSGVVLSSAALQVATRFSIALAEAAVAEVGANGQVLEEPRRGSAAISSVSIEARMLSIALVVGRVTAAAGQVLKEPRRGSAAMSSVSMEASTSLIALTEAAVAEVDANGQALQEPRSGAVLSSVSMEAPTLSIALAEAGVSAAGQVLKEPKRRSAALSSAALQVGGVEVVDCALLLPVLGATEKQDAPSSAAKKSRTFIAETGAAVSKVDAAERVVIQEDTEI